MLKRVDDFPNYLIDEDGNVFREKTMRKLKPSYSKGYSYVALCRNHEVKRCRVHRLVAKAYIPNPDGLPCINHKDENKKNNNVNNLEWCTWRYNNTYGKNSPVAKASEARRVPIVQFTKDGKKIAEYESSYEAMRQTGFCQQNISSCCVGKRKSANGYVWKHKYA